MLSDDMCKWQKLQMENDLAQNTHNIEREEIRNNKKVIVDTSFSLMSTIYLVNLTLEHYVGLQHQCKKRLCLLCNFICRLDDLVMYMTSFSPLSSSTSTTILVGPPYMSKVESSISSEQAPGVDNAHNLRNCVTFIVIDLLTDRGLEN